MLEKVLSPKQATSKKDAPLYRYYAGFSPQFCDTLLNELGADGSSLVLDPWNGAGTTTFACARNGVPSVGVDINPVMVLVAKFKFLDPDVILAGAAFIRAFVEVYKFKSYDISPFFEASLAAKELLHQNTDPDFEVIVHFLFACVCRRLASVAKTSNPTWCSTRRVEELRIQGSDLMAAIQRECEQISDWALLQRQTRGDLSANSEIIHADIRKLDFEDRKFTHLITSPPYLTRIDYVHKTLPELTYLRNFIDFSIGNLRRRMIGSVLTAGIEDWVVSGDYSNAILNKIKSHPSKASSSYYYRFYLNYITMISSSIQSIAKAMEMGSKCIFVSQGSYYKEIFVELPLIIKEQVELNGFKSLDSREFSANISMVSLNRRSFASRQKAVGETVSLFERTI